jgi:hypothetical protein
MGRGRGLSGMSLILLVLGLLLAAAGGASIGFGMPINELPLGATMILAGAFAVVGGLLLVGLWAVVTELARVTAALKAPQFQPQAAAARPARIEVPAPSAETVAREPAKDVVAEVESPPVPAAAATPAAPPGPTVEVSASAIERLRSSIPRPDKVVSEAGDAVPLSPNGQQATHQAEPTTQAERVPRSAGAAAVETREPRLDFLFRPRPRQTPMQQPQQEAFDSLWPKRPAREGQPDPRVDVAPAPAATSAPHPGPATEAAPDPAPAPQERTVAILKSGVVDGMAYTLYADGSIEAQLPQGTVRFGSIAELRAHIENKA